MKTLLSEIAYTVRGEVISEENIYYNYNKNGKSFWNYFRYK